MDLKKPMLGVFAHPDDETFLLGGLFALAHTMGASTSLMCLTRGEKGMGHLKKPMNEHDLAKARSQELKDAAKTLGVDKIFIFDYPDGGVRLVPQNEILEKIIAVIEETKPYRIVIFGPEGGTGHKDHITVHAIATQAFQNAQRLEDPPRELYWRAFPKSTQKLFLKPLDGRPRTETNYYKDNLAVPYKDRDIEFIDIAPVLAIKNRLRLCTKYLFGKVGIGKNSSGVQNWVALYINLKQVTNCCKF
jgi:LmbE family N-acetylglucosaminyl deacetylase